MNQINLDFSDLVARQWWFLREFQASQHTLNRTTHNMVNKSPRPDHIIVGKQRSHYYPLYFYFLRLRVLEIWLLLLFQDESKCVCTLSLGWSQPTDSCKIGFGALIMSTNPIKDNSVYLKVYLLNSFQVFSRYIPGSKSFLDGSKMFGQNMHRSYNV